jgi:hypothetical protein
MLLIVAMDKFVNLIVQPAADVVMTILQDIAVLVVERTAINAAAAAAAAAADVVVVVVVVERSIPSIAAVDEASRWLIAKSKEVIWNPCHQNDP